MKWQITCTAIVCIAALEGYAMHLGINGVVLTFVIGALAALAGVAIPTPNFLKGDNK